MADELLAPAVDSPLRSSGGTAVAEASRRGPRLLRRLMRRWFWLRMEIFRNSAPPEQYADSLLELFAGGLQVTKDWFAFVDHVDLDVGQVALRIRLLKRSGPEYAKPRVDREPTTKRPDPSAPLPRRTLAPARPDEELVLEYTFLTSQPLETNLGTFRDYASRELRRLRSAAPASA